MKNEWSYQDYFPVPFTNIYHQVKSTGNNEKADAAATATKSQCVFSSLFLEIYLFSIALTSVNEKHSSFSIQNTIFVIVNFKMIVEIEGKRRKIKCNKSKQQWNK